MSPYPVTTRTSASSDEGDPGPWELRAPGDLLHELFALVPCRPGVVVALVRHPSTDQQLLAAVPVQWRPYDGDPDDVRAVEDDGDQRSQLLRRAATRLWGRRSRARGVPEHAFVTIVVRRGRVVPGEQEALVHRAWRFTNHLLPVHDGEVALVTEHGWRCGFDDSCGAEPALRLEAAGDGA